MTTIPLQGRKKILNRAALPVQKTELPVTLKTMENTDSKQLYANFGSATCEIKQSSSSVLGPFCHSKLCFIYFQINLKEKEDVYF